MRLNGCGFLFFFFPPQKYVNKVQVRGEKKPTKMNPRSLFDSKVPAVFSEVFIRKMCPHSEGSKVCSSELKI